MEITGLFANAKVTIELAPGDVLFRVNDPATAMFGVISGEIELRKGDRRVTTVGPNGVFGELALVDSSPRSLDAVATQDTVLASIDRRLFLFLITETPMFALQVMTSMANRLRELTPA
ncbi:MAG TPA: cyclic nucleotide-binding domain-containing protein [Sporichthyaceae bacterium]|nr:cyclic nucleotide-binding domain-containing protein [Sporichthyaceae bacterium]